VVLVQDPAPIRHHCNKHLPGRAKTQRAGGDLIGAMTSLNGLVRDLSQESDAVCKSCTNLEMHRSRSDRSAPRTVVWRSARAVCALHPARVETTEVSALRLVAAIIAKDLYWQQKPISVIDIDGVDAPAG